MRTFTSAAVAVLLQVFHLQYVTAFVIQPHLSARTLLHQSAVAEVSETSSSTGQSVDKIRYVETKDLLDRNVQCSFSHTLAFVTGTILSETLR
jgi:hypothetical protein